MSGMDKYGDLRKKRLFSILANLNYIYSRLKKRISVLKTTTANELKFRPTKKICTKLILTINLFIQKNA